MPKKITTVENQDFRAKVENATNKIYKNCNFSFSLIRGDLRNTQFIQCNLYHADFRQAHLTKSTLIDYTGQRHPLAAAAKYTFFQKKLMGWDTAPNKADTHNIHHTPQTHWLVEKINSNKKPINRTLSDNHTKSTGSLTHTHAMTHSSTSLKSLPREQLKRSTTPPPRQISFSTNSRPPSPSSSSLGR